MAIKCEGTENMSVGDEKRMDNTNQFFYVYDKSLAKLLRYDKGFTFICTARHLKTNDQFWQFNNTPELHEAVKEFAKTDRVLSR